MSVDDTGNEARTRSGQAKLFGAKFDQEVGNIEWELTKCYDNSHAPASMAAQANMHVCITQGLSTKVAEFVRRFGSWFPLCAATAPRDSSA